MAREKNMTTAVSLANVSKNYNTGAGCFNALLPLDIGFEVGEFVGLVGPSGSGKSTLLNLLSGIDHPSSGQVTVAGASIAQLSESELADFRGRNIGIVFQFFQLVPTLTVLENVLLAMDLVGSIPRLSRQARALGLLEQVGVRRHRHKLPAQLSGGEQQRVAIARALANDPPILVADEPTGNLDSENSDMITELFEDCARDGRLVVVATHESQGLERFSRVVSLADGALTSDQRDGGILQCLTA
jgi:putative ABC transport system ATP-binding protein